MQLPHRKPLLRPITPSASSSSTPTPLPAHLQAVSWRGFGRWWPLPLIGRRRFGGEVQGFLESGAAEHGKMSQVVLEIVSKYRTFDNIGKNRTSFALPPRLLVCPEFFCADTDRKLPYTRYNISKPYRYCFLFYRSISNTINNATRYTDTDRKLQPTVRDNEIVSIRFLFNRYRIKLDYRSIPNGVWKGDILGGERF